MRRVNAILSMIILVLFLIHGVLGAFNLMGSNVTSKVLAWVMTGLIGLHAVIGVILTIQTLSAQKKAGVSYRKENRIFWARRISGYVIMILIFFHITAFTLSSTGTLPEFHLFRLLTQLLLVIAIAFHVLSNVKPMLIALGIKKLKPKAGDLLFWISLLWLVMAVGFVIYYLRWNAV